MERALASIDGMDDPIEAAAVLAHRVVRAQGFGKGNKRTALLLVRWLLDRNGLDGSAVIPHDDQAFADLLVRAAAGGDVEAEMKTLFLTDAERSRLGGFLRRTAVGLTGRRKNLAITTEAPVRLSHRHAKQRTAGYRTLT